MKSLFHDRRGEERLLPLFVMLATMITVIILMSNYLSIAIARNTPTGNWNQYEGWEIIGDNQYIMLDPVDGYNVTMANHTSDRGTDDSDKKFEFDMPDWQYLTVRLIRDASFPPDSETFGQINEVYFHARVSPSAFGHSHRWSMPFDSLTKYYLEGNVSYATIEMFGANVTIFITTDTDGTNASDHSEHIAAMYAGDYNIKLGLNVEAEITAQATTSMWVVLGQILSLDLPRTNIVVDMILFTACWAAIGFMAFTIISRMIPFISGG